MKHFVLMEHTLNVWLMQRGLLLRLQGNGLPKPRARLETAQMWVVKEENGAKIKRERVNGRERERERTLLLHNHLSHAVPLICSTGKP